MPSSTTKKQSLAELIKEWIERLKRSLKGLALPRFSVWQEEMEKSLSSLEFNQEYTMEALEDILKKLNEADDFIKSVEEKQAEVSEDLLSFIDDEKKDVVFAKVDIANRPYYIFFDRNMYERLYDAEGNYKQEEAEKLLNDSPFNPIKTSDVFRVYTMTNAKEMMHRMDDVVEDNGEAVFHISDFGVLRNVNLVGDFDKIPVEEKKEYISSLLAKEFGELKKLGEECKAECKAELKNLELHKDDKNKDVEEFEK
jgi:uncharacterized protein YukE